MDAIVTLGIRAKEGVYLFAPFRIRLVRESDVPSLVVHPVLVAVLEYAVIATAAAFPERVVDEADLAGHRPVEPEFRLARQPFDERLVNKQLPSASNVHRFSGMERGKKAAGNQARRQAAVEGTGEQSHKVSEGGGLREWRVGE
jgi:hypothetical protein